MGPYLAMHRQRVFGVEVEFIILTKRVRSIYFQIPQAKWNEPRGPLIMSTMAEENSPFDIAEETAHTTTHKKRVETHFLSVTSSLPPEERNGGGQDESCRKLFVKPKPRLHFTAGTVNSII